MTQFKNRERAIQIDNNNGLYILTNYGRIYFFNEEINEWVEIEFNQS